MSFDRKDFLLAKKRLQDSFTGLGWSIIILFILVIIVEFISKQHGVSLFRDVAFLFLFLMVLIFSFFAFLSFIGILVRMYFVLQKIARHAWLWILGSILGFTFLPFGIGMVFIPLFVRYEANKYLRENEQQNNVESRLNFFESKWEILFVSIMLLALNAILFLLPVISKLKEQFK